MEKLNKKVLIFIFVLFICSFTSAQRPVNDKLVLKKLINEYEAILSKNPNDVQTLKTLGILYHNLSYLGDKSASKNAVEYLLQANQLVNNSDAEILVYLGSSYTLKARDSALPSMKIYYVRKGCELIDKAVKLQPKNVTVRMVRINNSLALPAFFDRLKYAEQDCLFLIRSYEKNELKLDKETLAEVYFHLGEIYYKKGSLEKASNFLQKAIETSPDSSFAIRAKEKLSQLKQ